MPTRCQQTVAWARATAEALPRAQSARGQAFSNGLICSPCFWQRHNTSASSPPGPCRPLPPAQEWDFLQQQRAEQNTDSWKDRYQARAGVEGSISQAVHRTSARRTRYRSLPKTTLAHSLTGAALNLYCLDAWWTGTPLGTTHVSHYEQPALTLAA
ncbi:transposase [Streptomyces noursei]|uniref:transposase n=1 Tax=Streptomyces noursei TaxID=1971 RepID=UPI003817779B